MIVGSKVGNLSVSFDWGGNEFLVSACLAKCREIRLAKIRFVAKQQFLSNTERKEIREKLITQVIARAEKNFVLLLS